MADYPGHGPFARELTVASRLARAAGAVAMRHYDGDMRVEYKPREGNSPVTIADREANALIVAGLADAFPDDAVLAEESQDPAGRGDCRRLWCVDPIDGTRDYVARNGQFIVMIGLAVDSEARLGVLFHPPSGRLMVGAGEAAYVEVDGTMQPLRVSQTAAAADATMMVSRFHRSRGAEEAAAALGVRACRPMGSVGLKMAELALGLAEIYVSTSTCMHEWDACGPEAVLRAAGGAVTDVCGAPLRYNKPEARTPRGILATNGRLHPYCQDALQPLAAARGWR